MKNRFVDGITRKPRSAIRPSKTPIKSVELTEQQKDNLFNTGSIRNEN